MEHRLLARRLVVSAVLVAVALLVGSSVFRRLTAASQEPARKAEEAPAVAVRVVEVARSDFRETLVGYGRVRALRATTVAAEVGGLVRHVAPLEAGAAVEAGTELVRIDDRDAVAALAGARARVERNAADGARVAADLATNRAKLAVAEEELAIAERELRRVESLAGSDAGTRSEVDRERMGVAARRVQVLEWQGRIESLAADRERIGAEAKDLRAAVSRAETDLERTVVQAPWAGRVEARFAEPGARVAPGSALFALVDPDRIEIPVALPASRYGDVGPGAGARVELGDASWTATVKRVAPSVRADDRTFDVYLEVDRPGVPPGAFVTARIDGAAFAGVIVVPRTAFLGDRVYVVADGVARERTPRVRHALPHLLLVEDGLDEGARIAVSNLDELADGMRVVAISP